MKKLQFDDGCVDYKVGQGVLRFNPCDPGLYERFVQAVERIGAMTVSAGALAEADSAIRAELSGVFPGCDLQAIFPQSMLSLCKNGKVLAVNFLEAVEGELLDGLTRYVRESQ